MLGPDAGRELFGGLVVAPVAGRDAGAVAGQGLADGRADAAGAAGNQGDPVRRPGVARAVAAPPKQPP